MSDNAKTKYEHAKSNTFGTGMACFATERDQERAFNNAFMKEALAARIYISDLEHLLAQAETTLARSLELIRALARVREASTREETDD